jgi:hypothetical protein
MSPLFIFDSLIKAATSWGRSSFADLILLSDSTCNAISALVVQVKHEIYNTKIEHLRVYEIITRIKTNDIAALGAFKVFVSIQPTEP